jgi:hypothetical protein
MAHIYKSDDAPKASPSRFSRLKTALGQAGGTSGAPSPPQSAEYISRVIADRARQRAAESGFRAGGASEREAQEYYRSSQETPRRAARASIRKVLGD